MVQVMGLEEQLTVPSRNQPQLVDVWVAIRQATFLLEWQREFEVIAGPYASRLSASGAFHLFTMSEEQGWVVARRVDPLRNTASGIESLVREIVERANMRLAPHDEDVVEETARAGWVVRVRTTLAAAASVLAGVWQAPRATRDSADIASSR